MTVVTLYAGTILQAAVMTAHIAVQRAFVLVPVAIPLKALVAEMLESQKAFHVYDCVKMTQLRIRANPSVEKIHTLGFVIKPGRYHDNVYLEPFLKRTNVV